MHLFLNFCISSWLLPWVHEGNGFLFPCFIFEGGKAHNAVLVSYLHAMPEDKYGLHQGFLCRSEAACQCRPLPSSHLRQETQSQHEPNWKHMTGGCSYHNFLASHVN